MAKFEKDNEKTNEKEAKKEIKKETKKEQKAEKNIEPKKSLWTRFRIFCHGVKSETLKIHWPVKKDMIRYSVATIFFIIFCAGFFYLIDIIFAMIQLIFK